MTPLPVVATGVFVPVLVVVAKVAVPRIEACTMRVERSVGVVVVEESFAEVVPASLVALPVVVVALPDVFAVVVTGVPVRRLVACAIKVERSAVGVATLPVTLGVSAVVSTATGAPF